MTEYQAKAMAWVSLFLLLACSSGMIFRPSWVMLYAFERWHHLPATFLAGLVMVLGASSLSFAMFKSGAWVNFSLPLIAVYVHNYIEVFKEASKSRKKHP